MVLSRQQKASLNAVAGTRRRMARTGYTNAGQLLWSTREVDFLVGAYPDYDLAVRQLPGRTRRAIRQKARRLGLARREPVWDEAGEKKLKPRYPTTEPVRAIATELEKSSKQVWSKANRLRLRRPRRRPKDVADPILHSIRQRAFDLNISLTELGEATSSGAYFLSPGRRRRHLAIIRALRVLGGTIVLSAADA